jgi:hypothetical protein
MKNTLDNYFITPKTTTNFSSVTDFMMSIHKDNEKAAQIFKENLICNRMTRKGKTCKKHKANGLPSCKTHLTPHESKKILIFF